MTATIAAMAAMAATIAVAARQMVPLICRAPWSRLSADEVDAHPLEDGVGAEHGVVEVEHVLQRVVRRSGC
jgi:hypothetical protein